MGSRLFFPIHQNVLWSFLISIGLIHWNETVKAQQLWKRILVGFATLGIAYIGGIVTFVDYYNAGILMVLTFYFFRGNKWWNYAAQLLLMIWINKEVGGMFYQWELFGHSFEFQQQSFAVFALIPIWLYNGKQGYHSKWFRYFCYAFYPAHILILWLIMMLF